jgi:hypothetical protein
MTRMSTIPTIRWGTGIALLLLLLALPTWAFAAEERRGDAISGILQSSSLSQAEQAGLRSRAAAAVSGGVPAEDVEIIVSRAVQRGADAGTINRFLDVSLSAKKEGLPIGSILDRVEQGLSKGVPPERIAGAAQQLAQKLEAARPVVDDLIRSGVKPGQRNGRDAAIEATARAFEKAIPAQDLKEIGAAVRDQKGSLRLYTNAANTAAYFAGSGMSAKTSSNLVRSAVEKGYTERDLDGMVRQIDDTMRGGMRAEDAAMQMERQGMEGGHGMGQESGVGRGMGSSGPNKGGMGGRGR